MDKKQRPRSPLQKVAQAVGLALAVATVLAGCSGSGPGSGSGSGSEKPGEPIVLEFPSWQANEPGFDVALKAIVDEFESRHENAKVNLYFVSHTDYQNAMVTRLATGKAPDIIPGSQADFVAFAATGQLEPLTDRLKDAGILDNWRNFIEAAKWDGEYQALPMLAQARFLYYNEDMLSEAGIGKAPTTPDELRAAIDAVSALNLDGVATWGATTTSHPNLFGESNAFVVGIGGGWITDGKWSVTSPKTVEALELYRELTKQAPPGNDGGKYRQLFAEGRIAMIHDGNWVQTFLDEVSPPEIHDKLIAAPTPFASSVAEAGTLLSIPKGSSDERKELAWDFISIAAEPKFQAMWATETGAAPGLEGAVTDEIIAANPIVKILEHDIAKGLPSLPDNENFKENFGEIQQRIIDAMMRLQTGDEPTMTILNDLQSQLESITEL